jgi:iron complex outermembrane recepter protein
MKLKSIKLTNWQLSLLFGARLLAGLLILSPAISMAQEGDPAESAEEVFELSPFEVRTAEEAGYAPTNVISATRVAMDLKNLPLSLDIVTEKQIKDYELTELQDVVGAAAGVAHVQEQGSGALVSYTVRGFTTFFSARNGNTALRSYDSANVARVEVVNGPMSVLYGQVDPGGVANTVTKSPAATARTDLRLTVGSWDYIRAEVNTTGPLNESKSLTYRVDASFLDRSGYRDFDKDTKKFISPVLRWQIGDRTTVTADLEYLDFSIGGRTSWVRYDNRVTGEKRFATNAEVPYTFNGNGPGLGTEVERYLTTLTIEHRFDNGIVVRNQTGKSNEEMDLWNNNSTATVITANTPPGQLPWARGLAGGDRENDIFTNNLNVTGRIDFSPRHYSRWVLGWNHNDVDFTQLQVRTFGTAYPAPPAWDLADPSTWDRTVPPKEGASVQSHRDLLTKDNNYYAIMAFGLFDERLNFLGGASYSSIKLKSTDLVSGNVLNDEKRTRWTPQYGVIWRATPAIGLYVNYSESFRQISSLRMNEDQSLSPFDPLIAGSWDYGFKFDSADGRFTGQITSFNILYENARQQFTRTDDDGNIIRWEEQSGESRSEGYEVRFAANFTRFWQVTGGYTYTDARVTKNPTNPGIEGRWLPRSPKHIARLTTSYNMNKLVRGLSVGGTVSFQTYSKAFETNDPYFIDEHVVVNLRANYRHQLWGKPLLYNLVVYNAFGAKYFESSIGRSNPASFRLSVDYSF